MGLIKSFIKCVLWNNSEKYVWQGGNYLRIPKPSKSVLHGADTVGKALSPVSGSLLWGERKQSFLHGLCTDIPAPGRECVCIPLRNEKYWALLSWGFEIHHDLPSEESNCSVIESHVARQSLNVIFLSPSHYLGKTQRDVFWRFYVGFFFSDSLNWAEM